MAYQDFKGKRVIVTGASQGLGLAVATQLLFYGAQVIGLDIAFDAVIGDKNQPDGDGMFRFHLDISQRQSIKPLIDAIELQLGAIDYLASVAGILRMSALLEHTEQDWLDTFDVNCHGPFILCQAVAKHMKKRGNGAIVAVGSNAANTARLNMGSYCASKAALTALIKGLALELAADGIRCNLVAPGSTDTPMQRLLWRDEHGLKNTILGNGADYKLGIPLQRIATPDDVAKVVLFLLSDQARHITMENLLIDGGATLGH
jgi:2,3-dihydro-2,3-dihydroxybenzoate dehydrogenase